MWGERCSAGRERRMESTNSKELVPERVEVMKEKQGAAENKENYWRESY